MKLIIGIVIGLALSICVKSAHAEWQRLHQADCLDMEYGGAVCIVWDELEQTNCYVYSRRGHGDSALAGGIDCVRKGEL